MNKNGPYGSTDKTTLLIGVNSSNRTILNLANISFQRSYLPLILARHDGPDLWSSTLSEVMPDKRIGSTVQIGLISEIHSSSYEYNCAHIRDSNWVIGTRQPLEAICMSKTDSIIGVTDLHRAYAADSDKLVESDGMNRSADDIFRSTAIAILTWNDCAKTERCLESLQSSGYDLGRVVLWDNGSIDDTEDLIAQKFPNVIYHRHDTNLGVPSGRNAVASLAIRTLSPSHLMFLDNDMVVLPGFLEALCIPFLEDPLVGQTHAKIRFFNEPLRLQSAGGMVVKFHRGVTSPIGYGEIDSGQYDVPRSCIPSGGATLVAVKIFSTFGGFDPVFDPYGFEDIDFSLRLNSAGLNSIYVPQAVILHDKIYSRKEGLGHSDVFVLFRNWLVVLHRYATRWQRVGFWLFGVPTRTIGYCYREVRKGNFAAPKNILLGVVKFWNRRHLVSEAQLLDSDRKLNDAD